ncbi:MAG: UDP-N-acetylglucosamine 2-epimerase (non-hydrolyzing) [Chloroflexota bacterium]
MRIASVVGTRPQLIKAAALQPALRARHDEIFIDTGQHWDAAMAGAFFAELGLARPDYSLGAGGGSQASQTAAMLLRLEPVLLEQEPDLVMVYGDTNSTLAGTLTAAKLGLPVAHVEAGLRSFDRRMPEELNRIVTDHLSTWLLAPTPAAVEHLGAEGITRGVTLVGDLMLDLAARISLEVRDAVVLRRIAHDLGHHAGRDVDLLPGAYLFATIHRAENRDPAALKAAMTLLDRAARPTRPVVLALHPGTRVALERAGIAVGPNVVVVEPQSYRTSLALQLHAAAVLTDSGGVQRESAWLGVPCLVLRSTTEWTETIDASAGATRLVGTDAALVAAALDELAPVESSAALAVGRAAALNLRPAGAAAAIVAAINQVP